MTAHCMEITSSHLTVVAVPGRGVGASYGFVVFVYRKRRAVLAHLGKETPVVLCKVSLFPTHVGRSAGESHLGEKI